MSLIVALGDEGEASGQLFWDDGESIGQLLSHSCCFCELFLNQLFCTSYWKMLTLLPRRVFSHQTCYNKPLKKRCKAE